LADVPVPQFVGDVDRAAHLDTVNRVVVERSKALERQVTMLMQIVDAPLCRSRFH
jgi:hypothetical protein